VQARAFREVVMSDIRGINSASPTPPIEPTKATSAAPKVAQPSQPTDTVEISQQAIIASKIAELPQIRADLVARVKGEIQAGTYETPEKLDVAIQRLLEEL
jgi:negative regulator of flagellin synthesis FlgM